MADKVRAALERSLPELKFLESKNIFNREEIRDIVKNRKRHEYSINKRSATKLDFLNYIQYEFQLEMEKRTRMTDYHRQKILKSKKIDHLEFASILKIFSLYEKALSKFRRDIELWTQYITFCEKMGFKRRLGFIFTRALQFNSHVPDIWLLATNWEFTVVKDVKATRALYQRGLRFNQSSRELWQNYFEFELNCLAKIKSKTRIEFKPASTEDTSIDLSKVPDGKEENDEQSPIEILKVAISSALPEDANVAASGAPALELTQERKAILNGLIPLTIYRHAVKAISSDFAFRRGFLTIANAIDASENVAQEITRDIEDTFGNNPVIWTAYALETLEKMIEVEDLEWKEITGLISHVENNAKETQSPEVWEKVINFYSTVESMFENTDISKQAHEHLQSLFSTLLDGGKFNQKIAEQWAHCCTKAFITPASVELLKSLLNKFPRSKIMWITLASWQSKLLGVTSQSAKEIDRIFENGLSKCPKSDQPDLWLNQALYYTYIGAPWSDIDRLLKTAISKAQIGDYVPIKESYLKLAFQHEGIEKVRQLLSSPHFKCGSMSPSIFTLAVGMEMACQPINTDSIRRIYASALDVYGKSDLDLWVAAIQFEKNHGNTSQVGNLVWKAKKTLPPQLHLSLDQALTYGTAQ
eukprot:TRINITY_DN8307_c0_g1_i2.p1 TRINITY_DN8307_c0_g1~~TRINITY_DN8307_c0_g1_i2.p1  ORF type:complete len:644 (-),score=123.80 TRINITY_DN8307_c0_g1_i2:211-2142(-)